MAKIIDLEKYKNRLEALEGLRELEELFLDEQDTSSSTEREQLIARAAPETLFQEVHRMRVKEKYENIRYQKDSDGIYSIYGVKPTNSED